MSVRLDTSYEYRMAEREPNEGADTIPILFRHGWAAGDVAGEVT